MRTSQFAAALSLTLFLAACGGGGGGTSQSTQAQFTAPASSPTAATAAPPTSAEPPATPSQPTGPSITIAIYGDDQMMGNWINGSGSPSMVTPNEPQALQALLSQQFNVVVQNYATGGTASSLPNELDGMDGGGQPQPARMIASGARIAIEQHTLNDNLGGETIAQYSAYLGQWIQDAKSAGIQPILEEASPVCDGNHPRLAAYVQAMDEVAITYNVPIIKQYAMISSINGWQSHMLNCIVPDAYLDGLKAQQELAVIGPFVKTLIGSP